MTIPLVSGLPDALFLAALRPPAWCCYLFVVHLKGDELELPHGNALVITLDYTFLEDANTIFEKFSSSSFHLLALDVDRF